MTMVWKTADLFWIKPPFLNHFFIVPNLKTNCIFYIHRFSHAWNCDVRSLKHHLETKKENKDKNSSKHSVTWIVMVIWQVFCYWKKRKTGVPPRLLINIRFGCWCWMIILLKNYLVMNLIIWKDFKKNKQV